MGVALYRGGDSAFPADPRFRVQAPSRVAPGLAPEPWAILLFVLASAAFSTLGAGAATRAGTVAWFLWVAYVGVLLIQEAERSRVRTAV